MTALPLPPSTGSIKAKNGRLCDKPGDRPVPGKNRYITRHLFFVFKRVYGDA
jgi:hypothetical protein